MPATGKYWRRVNLARVGFQRAIAAEKSAPRGAAHENFKKWVEKRITTVDNTMTAR
jgi:hypothetical protein